MITKTLFVCSKPVGTSQYCGVACGTLYDLARLVIIRDQSVLVCRVNKATNRQVNFGRCPEAIPLKVARAL